MNARSDRRGFLRGLATVPLVGGGVALTRLPGAAAPAVFAPVQDLAERATVASHRYDRLEMKRWDIQEQITEALKPYRAALEVRPDDPYAFCQPSRPDFDGRRRYDLRRLSTIRRVTNLSPEQEERRQEIVVALERYEAEEARLRAALGLEEEGTAEAEDVSAALYEQIVDTRAPTLAEILVKVRLVKGFYVDDEPGADGGPLDTRIAMSIVRDLLALDSAA